MLGWTAPPERDTYDERDRRAARDARGRLPVLRAERARVRAAASLSAVRLPARRAHDAPIRLPGGSVSRRGVGPVAGPRVLSRSARPACRPRTSLTNSIASARARSSMRTCLPRASLPPRATSRPTPGSSPASSGRRDPPPCDGNRHVGDRGLGDLVPVVHEQHVVGVGMACRALVRRRSCSVVLWKSIGSAGSTGWSRSIATLNGLARRGERRRAGVDTAPTVERDAHARGAIGEPSGGLLQRVRHG